MSNVLITGAAGLLGQHLVKALGDKHRIMAVDTAVSPFESLANVEYLTADLTDFPAIRYDVLNFKPEYIFNCAALTDVDRCEIEKNLAEKLNFELVNHLLTVPFEKIIHYSSDYVFDGKSGPYGEDDPTDPINYYGATKLHSENILHNAHVNYLIIRTNVLYGIAESVRKNFVLWVKESLEAGETISVVDDQYNNPISAANLAEASVEAAYSDISGVLHIAGNDYLSRYQTAVAIADYYKLNRDLIQKTKSTELLQKARRPVKGGLIIDKAKELLQTELLGIEGGLSLIDV